MYHIYDVKSTLSGKFPNRDVYLLELLKLSSYSYERWILLKSSLITWNIFNKLVFVNINGFVLLNTLNTCYSIQKKFSVIQIIKIILNSYLRANWNTYFCMHEFSKIIVFSLFYIKPISIIFMNIHLFEFQFLILLRLYILNYNFNLIWSFIFS